jgi:hypothetical protein
MQYARLLSSEADRISIIPSRLPTRGPWGGSCSGFDLKVIICGFCANFYFYLNYGRKIQFYLMKRTISVLLDEKNYKILK